MHPATAEPTGVSAQSPFLLGWHTGEPGVSSSQMPSSTANGFVWGSQHLWKYEKYLPLIIGSFFCYLALCEHLEWSFPVSASCRGEVKWMMVSFRFPAALCSCGSLVQGEQHLVVHAASNKACAGYLYPSNCLVVKNICSVYVIEKETSLCCKAWVFCCGMGRALVGLCRTSDGLAHLQTPPTPSNCIYSH